MKIIAFLLLLICVSKLHTILSSPEDIRKRTENILSEIDDFSVNPNTMFYLYMIFMTLGEVLGIICSLFILIL